MCHFTSITFSGGTVWFALVEVAVVGGLVIYEAGVAAIPGVMVTFLTQPLQVAFYSLC